MFRRLAFKNIEGGFKFLFKAFWNQSEKHETSSISIKFDFCCQIYKQTINFSKNTLLALKEGPYQFF